MAPSLFRSSASSSTNGSSGSRRRDDHRPAQVARATALPLEMPGQALGYMIGETEIFRLRDLAQKRLGDKFDLKDFHEVALSHGAVPLSVLGIFVNQWLERVAPAR